MILLLYTNSIIRGVDSVGHLLCLTAPQSVRHPPNAFPHEILQSPRERVGLSTYYYIILVKCILIRIKSKMFLSCVGIFALRNHREIIGKSSELAQERDIYNHSKCLGTNSLFIRAPASHRAG